MAKSAIELQAQQEVDRDILTYVREMQKTAPVELEGVYAYLIRARRRSLTRSDVQDRMNYLESAGYLAKKQEWDAGETMTFWTITAAGMDLLDGAIPPRNWKRQ